MEFKYNQLEERTLKYSFQIISLVKTIPRNKISDPITNQLLRSATSVGANYIEANEVSSKKERKYKIQICKTEAKESLYWLKLLSFYLKNDLIKNLINETQELILIFSAIYFKFKD